MLWINRIPKFSIHLQIMSRYILNSSDTHIMQITCEQRVHLFSKFSGLVKIFSELVRNIDLEVYDRLDT